MAWFASILFAIALVGAQPPASSTAGEPPAATPSFATAEQLLDAVAASDAKIDTLHTTIRYETVQDLLDDKQVRKGTAVLHISPDRKLKQFRVSFTQFISSRGLEEQSRDYIFDGRYLVERLNDEKQFIKREVVRPGQEMDPMAIDGPLPLPIGQGRESILKRFTAELLEPETDEADRLKGYYRLRLTARNADDDLEMVDLWYDPQTLLPGRALITERGGDTVQVDLANTTINDAEVDPAEFSTESPSLDDGWRIDIRMLEDDPAL
ncbi:MAG: outer membrane lipoprotein carrier protein LolA [Phycisphaerales bacterium]|nr:outer membrane lipoprotein carrier protein LolA [Phycisphaerales bacterium]